MNNNGFAILRYFHDLGYDANLVLFKDDQAGTSDHFSIKADTWYFKKWNKHIIKLPIYNSYGAALKQTLWIKILLFSVYLFKKLFKSYSTEYFKSAQKKELDQAYKILKDYQFYIGSGAVPAIFENFNLSLNVFFPYSIGIEYINQPNFRKHKNSKNPITKYLANKLYQQQANGIKKAKYILTADLSSHTLDALEKLQKTPEVLFLPMLYPFEKPKKNHFSDILNDTLKIFKKHDFIIFSHTRHQWKCPDNFSSCEWGKISKNNHWAIMAFAKFLKKIKKNDAILIMLEYGEDYIESKKLCRKLNISKNVYWLPKLERKEIMELIKLTSVGVGEFYNENVFWGGVGWEFLSQGCPLIHGLHEDENSFQIKYNVPMPPISIANSVNDILACFLELYNNVELRDTLKKESKDWFINYNSHNSAMNIIDLLEQ